MKTANNLVVELTLAHGLALDLIRDLSGGDNGRVLADAQSLTSVIDSALNLANTLSRADGAVFYVRARRLSDFLDHGLLAAGDLHLAWGSDRANDLCQVLIRASSSVGVLVRYLEGATMPSTMSSRLTGWAARLLPVADRLEYAELFRSELHDLAQSGSGRWTQLRYALRVLMRAPLLRRELRTPAPATPERL